MLMWSFSQCKFSSNSCPLLRTYFFVCDFNSSKGRAEEKGGRATARAATHSPWAEGREAAGTALYGWTILVQLISAKGWTSRRKERSFLQARQKALLCAFHFSVRNWYPWLNSLLSSLGMSFPSPQLLGQAPITLQHILSLTTNFPCYAQTKC